MAELKEPKFRMVLVGKTGVGKSAAGNSILGRKAFESKLSLSSLTSVCQKETGTFENQTLAVVDTPGLSDTRRNYEKQVREIARCISFSAPGPHVFLVVIQVNRFTKEEKKTVKLIQKVFGEEAARYTMVLFTRGDDMEADGVSAEECISDDTDLHTFINQCAGKYHVFNNRENDPSQVRELLQKIKKMVQKNGGSFYTNQMLQEAERAIKEKTTEILNQNPSTSPASARRMAERDNDFIKKMVVRAGVGAVLGAVVGGVVGGVVGAAVGAAVGGQRGSVVGAVLGAVVGVAVGAAVGDIAQTAKEDCVIQ